MQKINDFMFNQSGCNFGYTKWIAVFRSTWMDVISILYGLHENTGSCWWQTEKIEGSISNVPTNFSFIFPHLTRFLDEISLREGNFIFCCSGSWENYLGWLIGKIIILNLRIGTFKNENIYHPGKETCAYVKYHISFLCKSVM